MSSSETTTGQEKKSFQMLRTYSWADILTLGNAACGISSIFVCLNYVEEGPIKGKLWPVFVLLSISLLCDIFDGIVARKSRRSSLLGEDLDSLADVISFGVAPAVLAFTLGMRGFWDSIILIYFVLCGVSRLARFNATTDQLKSDSGKVEYYEGTPIPTSLFVVLALLIAVLMGHYGKQLWFGEVTFLTKTLHPLVFMYFLSGTAMISSRLKIPKF